MGAFVEHNGGGGLEIPKCAIYTLEWNFDEHEIPFIKKNNIIHQYSIIRNKNQTKNASLVKRYSFLISWGPYITKGIPKETIRRNLQDCPGWYQHLSF